MGRGRAMFGHFSESETEKDSLWEKREVSKLNLVISKLYQMFVRFKNWVTSESTQSDQKFMMCVFEKSSKVALQDPIL